MFLEGAQGEGRAGKVRGGGLRGERSRSLHDLVITLLVGREDVQGGWYRVGKAGGGGGGGTIWATSGEAKRKVKVLILF